MKKLSILLVTALMGSTAIIGTASAAPNGQGPGFQPGGGHGMQQQQGGPGQGSHRGGPGGEGGHQDFNGGPGNGGPGGGGPGAMGSQRSHGWSGPEAGGGPANWHRGEYLAPSFTQNRGYWLSDWRAHGLAAPPSGHRWLEVNGNFILASIATGVITNIIMGY